MAEHLSGTVEDELRATKFVLHSFMAEVALELARQREKPEIWARAFIGRLHRRVDWSGERKPSDLGYEPEAFERIHEQANQQIDWLGEVLGIVLGYEARKRNN